MNLAYMTVFFIQFMMTMELGSVYPIAPYLAELFGIDASKIILINIGFAGFGLAAPLFGILADRIGTRKTITSSLGVLALGMGVTAFSQSALHFLLGRAIIGAGFFSLSGLLVGYMGDLVPYEKRGRALGFVRFAFAIGILLAPVYASYMVMRIGIKGLYLQYMVGVLVALGLSLRLPKPDHHAVAGGLNWQEIKMIPKVPGAKIFMLLQFVLAIPAVFVYGYLSIYLHELAISQSATGWIYLIAGLGTAAGVLLAMWRSDRWGKARFGQISFSIMAISIFFVTRVPVALIAILLFFFAFGYDGGWPAFQALASEVMAERRATFMTIIYLTVSISNVLMYLIAPWVYGSIGFAGISWIAGISALVCVGLLFVIERKYAQKF